MLEHNCLTASQRRELVGYICTNISANSVYFLNKQENNKVSLAIATRYPHLKDSLDSGLKNAMSCAKTSELSNYLSESFKIHKCLWCH